MSPLTVRRLLHVSHALTVLALLATGALLGLPDLRAQLIGGYGRQILDIHAWAAWIFLAAPPAALALRGRALLRDLRRRLGPPDPVNWRKLHIVSSLVSSCLLSLSGWLLWTEADPPLWLIDAALEVHIVFSWLLAGLLPLHVFAARRKIAERWRDGFRTDVPPDPLWEDDSSQDDAPPV